MKRILFTLLALALMVSACAPKATVASGNSLKVTFGDTHKSYTLDELKALGNTQAAFKGVTYIGVPLTTLLSDAGIDPAKLSAVKAVGIDGFTANYDPSLFNLPNTLVAYARVNGPLADDELPFRMVLPDQEGKLNARQLAEIVALP
jgi:hypothetical protein